MIIETAENRYLVTAKLIEKSPFDILLKFKPWLGNRWKDDRYDNDGALAYNRLFTGNWIASDRKNGKTFDRSTSSRNRFQNESPKRITFSRKMMDFETYRRLHRLIKN